MQIEQGQIQLRLEQKAEYEYDLETDMLEIFFQNSQHDLRSPITMKSDPQIPQIAQIFIPGNPRPIFTAGVMTCGHTQ